MSGLLRKAAALLLVYVLAMLTAVSALAEVIMDRGSVIIACDGLEAEGWYALIVMEGVDASLEDERILYANQLQADGEGRISFAFVNYDLPECVFLLGGAFGDESSPKRLGLYEPAAQDAAPPAALEDIGEEAFAGATFEYVVLGSQVKRIDARAFAGCTVLQAVSFPSTLRAVGDSAFRNCSKLRRADLPDGVTSIGCYAFENCTMLEAFRYPKSLSSVGYYGAMLKGCTLLTSVTVPEGVTVLPTKAFQNCSALARISLPASLTSISNNAFQGCPSVALHVPRTSMGLVYAVDYGYPFVIENDTVSSNNIIDFSQSLYYANTDGANVNGCIAATLDYAVRDSVSVSGASLMLKVPNGTEIVETTLSLDGAMLKNYTIDNGRLTVPVGQQARGSLRFSLRLTSPVTELLSYAYLSCRANGTKTATWKQRGFQAAVSSFVWIKLLKPGKTWRLCRSAAAE